MVLNAAVGGSGLVAEPPAGTWRCGYQGEADVATGEAEHAQALDELCAALRQHLGDGTIPITAGGLVPEQGPSQAVVRVLVGLPARIEYAAYTDGVPNGGDGLGTGLVHYFREAAERLGDAMFAASRRASIAPAASVPHKPLDVRGSFGNATLAVEWSPPMCRWTDFVVQYSLDGGPWTTAPRPVPCDLHQTVSGLQARTVHVRVATVHVDTITEFTVPVAALHT